MMLISSAFSFINVSIIVVVLGLGIYTMVLLIKALKIYIKKNS
ncbi:hypothetical protein [Clostridium sp. DSM 17811]|nr:hypothetical protein [Clostridium sp. DSM 17811]